MPTIKRKAGANAKGIASFVDSARSYSEQRAAMWRGEPPPIDEAWLRHRQAVYEQFVKDVGGDFVIQFGPLFWA